MAAGFLPGKIPAAGKVSNSKQIKHEMLPHRSAKTSITGGSHGSRTVNQYAKLSPASVSGVGNSGLNILSMAKGA